jgi:lysozyme
MRTLGIDFSRWQDSNSTPQKMNCAAAKTAGAQFAFIKASQGTWCDEDFIWNYFSAVETWPVVGAYHYLDWTKPAKDQAKFFLGLTQNVNPNLLVVDYECRTNAPSTGTARLALKTFLTEVVNATGKRPIIYTGPGYWAEYGSPDLWWAQFPLWLAHYKTYTPIVPKPWVGWSFWQYTDEGDGIRFGAESREIDLNYWVGSYDGLLKFSQSSTIPPITPEVRPRYRCVVASLRVRSYPVTGAVVGGLTPNSPLEYCYEVRVIGGDTWLRLSMDGRPQRWACSKLGGLTLMELAA